MKAREPRRRVVVPTRMHVDATWSDAVILNISSRGMLMRSASPPAPRSYVDIRRGTQVVIGRVVWQGGDQFGVRTQDKIDIEALITEPRGRKPIATGAAPPANDRRTRSREASLGYAAERAKAMSELIQYLAIGAAVLLVAGYAGSMVKRVLSAPLQAVGAHLG